MNQNKAMTVAFVGGARLISALSGMLVIPIVAFDSVNYGVFSLQYGVAIAVGAFFVTLPIQAAQRRYDASAQSPRHFNLLCLLSALAAGLVAFFALFLWTPPGLAMMASLFVSVYVLATSFLTLLQLEKGAVVSAKLEAARGMFQLLLLGVLWIIPGPVMPSGVFSVLALSYVLLIAVLSERLRWPAREDWRHQVNLASLGLLIGAWAFLGGFIYVLVKWLLIGRISEDEFSTFTYQIDLISRMIGLVSSVVVTHSMVDFALNTRTNNWRQYLDTLRQATIIYIVLVFVSFVSLVALGLIAPPFWRPKPPLILLVSMVLAVAVVQYMPIAHKWVELTRGGAFPLAWLLASNAIVYLAFASIILLPTGLAPAYAALLSLGLGAAFYVAASLLIKWRPNMPRVNLRWRA